jgi:hypothetical protein
MLGGIGGHWQGNLVRDGERRSEESLLAACVIAYLSNHLGSALGPVLDQSPHEQTGNRHRNSQAANYEELYAHGARVDPVLRAGL